MSDPLKGKLKFHLVEERFGANIKVIGIGGGGGNAINRMIEAGIEGVEFIALNTDLQALSNNKAGQKTQIGNQLTKGLGSGGRPDTGKQAAMEDTERLIEIIEGADMVFLTTGLGGGTGTGATPIFANLASEMDILAIASYTGADPGLLSVKDKVVSLVERGDTYPLTPRYEPDEYSVADPEIVITAVKHYLDALKVQVTAKNMGAILGGRVPHYQTIVAGGVTQLPDAEKLARFKSMLDEVRAFVHDVYLPEALEAAKRAVALEPENSNIIDTLAEVYYRLGRIEEAIEAGARALELDPESSYLKEQLEKFRGDTR